MSWAMRVGFWGEEMDLCLAKDLLDFLNCLRMEHSLIWRHIAPWQISNLPGTCVGLNECKMSCSHSKRRSTRMKEVLRGEYSMAICVGQHSHALCFTETWLSEVIPGNTLHLPGYQLFRADLIAKLTPWGRSPHQCGLSRILFMTAKKKKILHQFW